MDPRLETLLSHVTGRVQRYRFAWNLTLFWILATLVVVGLLLNGELPKADARGAWFGIFAIGAVALVATAWLISRRQVGDRRSIASKIESKFPSLQQRLLTAVGFPPNESLGYLRRSLVDETIHHARANDWLQTIPTKSMFAAWLSNAVSFGCCLLACATMLMALGDPESSPLQSMLGFGKVDTVSVDPGNAEVERGSNVIVLARFADQVPAEAWLDATTESGKTLHTEMRRNLKDPVFGGYLLEVREDTTYTVDYLEGKSDSYRIRVFDFPAMVQSDAVIQSPSYSGIDDRTIEDTRRVTVVDGAKLIHGPALSTNRWHLRS